MLSQWKHTKTLCRQSQSTRSCPRRTREREKWIVIRKPSVAIRLTMQRLFNVITHNAVRRPPVTAISRRRPISYIAANGDKILADHLFDAAASATYIGLSSQNQMIAIVGVEIQREVVGRASALNSQPHTVHRHEGRNNRRVTQRTIKSPSTSATSER